jgi:hypothetical protein
MSAPRPFVVAIAALLSVAEYSPTVAQTFNYDDCFRNAQQDLNANSLMCDKQFKKDGQLHYDCVDLGQKRFKIAVTQCAKTRDDIRQKQGLEPLYVPPVVPAKNGGG